METIEINIETLSQWQQQLPQNVIALGFFDGLHKGHQQVIEVAKRRAKETWFTTFCYELFSPSEKCFIRR